MSNEYMRQIMESIEIAQQVTEGYYDRISQTVDAMQQEFPDGIMKKGFEQNLDMVNTKHNLGNVELRPTKASNSQSRRDFVKDVAAKINFKRDTSNVDAKKERTEKVLDDLAYLIDEAIGRAFPDMDPFDIIWPRAYKMGIRAMDATEWLDRAVRKHMGGKDYQSYVQSSWADHMETVYPDGHANSDAFG